MKSVAVWPQLKPSYGTSGMLAACIIQPMDMVKVIFTEPVIITACEFLEQTGPSASSAVTLLGGEDGKLRLGIRRATRPRSAFSDSAVANHNSYSKVLSSVSNVVSTKKTFHIFYSPREAEFAIPAGTSQDREIPSLCTTRIQMDKWKMFDAHLLRSPPLLRLNCFVHDFPPPPRGRRTRHLQR